MNVMWTLVSKLELGSKERNLGMAWLTLEKDYTKQEHSYSGVHFSLACLEIRSRNEEATINSTRNRIYSLKVFYLLLHRRRYFFNLFLNCFSTRFSDDPKYVCGRRLYECINTRKFKGLDSKEITSLPDIKKVIYMALHFDHRRK